MTSSKVSTGPAWKKIPAMEPTRLIVTGMPDFAAMSLSPPMKDAMVLPSCA